MLKDLVPPQNEEAEQATLGSLLLDPKAYEKVEAVLGSRDFYRPGHRTVYEAIKTLHMQAQAVDLLSLTNHLKAHNQLDSAGGALYVSELTSKVPSSANVEFYAQLVKEASLRRDVIQLAQKITSQALDSSLDSRLLLEEAEKQIFDLGQSRNIKSYQHAKTLVTQVVDIIQKLYQSKAEFTGVPTGFRELDSMTSGFQRAELIILAARPSIGKTTLALNMASYMSLHKKVPVGFFSCEMPDLILLMRVLAAEARLDFGKIKTGLLKPGDFVNIQEAVGLIYEAPLFIDDTPNIPLLDLRAKARQMRSKDKIQALFIDYISLISHENKDLPRHEQVAEVSRSLKALARELDIPVIALSQVSRETEGKRPTLNHLRESGSLEQDADLVMFLHRERLTEKDETGAPPTVQEVQLIIEKNRNGPLGTIPLIFKPQYTLFTSLEREDG